MQSASHSQRNTPAAPHPIAVWLSLLVLIFSGCTAPGFTPPADPPPEPSPVATAPASAPELAAFEEEVKTALGSQDWQAVEGLIADEFLVGFWRGNSLPLLTPREAAAQLERLYLPQKAPTFPPPDAPYTEMLSGLEPLEIWPPELNVKSLVYSSGWGAEGIGEALLAIGEDAAGNPRWVGVLIAPTGFDRLM